jgi:hypothetical protein
MAAPDTARASLFGFIGAGLEEDDCPTFAAALDAYVHELAEEIRADAEQHRVARERSAGRRAADLIDPKEAS